YLHRPELRLGNMMKRVIPILVFLLFSLSQVFSVTLEELDKVMLKNNPTIRQSEETVLQAALDVKDAKANYQPTISLSGSATYMMDPPLGAITMESSSVLSQMGLGAYSNLASGYVTLYDGMENTMYMGSLSLTQPIFTWGKLSKAVDLYSYAYDANVNRRTDVVRQNQAELRVRLWSLKYLEELEELVGEAIDLSQELVDIAKSGFENGMVLKQDYLSAQISQMETEIREAEVEKNKNDVLVGLEALLGDHPLDLSSLVLEEDFSRYMARSKEELLAKATSSSSSNISAARDLLSVYTTQKEIAERSMYGLPDFALQVSLSLNGSRLPLVETGWRQKGSHSLNLSVGFSSTLWDGGKILHNLEKAKSNIRTAEATLDSAYTQIKGAVESNLTSMSYCFSNMEYLESKIQNKESELELLKTQVAYGQKSRMDVITKELEIVAEKSTLVTMRIQLAQNVFTLDYLVGEGF
ncbi:MAG: TolC family protein, partial [Spirochaetales bacterium]|nr:TolC family protein [Candidatus Physcosoma equi]